MTLDAHSTSLRAADGHAFALLHCLPAQPRARLLWLPALGVAARHYLPLAQALAAQGIAVYLHEWRGNGSSSLRPSRVQDWGYREILEQDLQASQQLLFQHDQQDRVLPWIVGGHSLGGQLACLHAGRFPADFEHLWLVASGTPWWRSFPAPRGWLLPLAYRFLPWLARRNGVLPGRRLGFGGNEARGLIQDWSRVGLSNRYAAAGMAEDLESQLRLVQGQARAVLMADDWLAPAGSMQALLAKLPDVRVTTSVLDAAMLRTRADHFHWMKAPQAVAQALLRSFD
jgi:predicted alpha/beta hydrolase